MQGYKFRVIWAATSLVVTVNAKDYDAAERKIMNKHKKALFYNFLEVCDPIQMKDPFDAKQPKKVF
jgi:hypothetical protein